MCFSPSRTSFVIARFPVFLRRQGRAAFSLIEVILAIGLVTFALLVIFSLVPTGLATLQAVSRQIVETEILNTVGAEFESTPFDQMEAFCDSRFPQYFDAEGIEMDGAAGAVFTVRCTLEKPELGAGELRRARVAVGYQRDPESNDTSGRVTRRTLLLVDKGI